jgi:hypothetical protein
MIRRLLALALLAAALPAAAQSTPTTNYTDLWYNPLESGWGVAFTQHASNQAFAMWYTYDPREQDPSSPGNFKPLWIVMSGGTWTSPTTITGPVYVLNGVPFSQPGSSRTQTQVGSFTIHFTDASHAEFTYNIAPPAGLAASDPAFGLPALTGTKQMERIQF